MASRIPLFFLLLWFASCLGAPAGKSVPVLGDPVSMSGAEVKPAEEPTPRNGSEHEESGDVFAAGHTPAEAIAERGTTYESPITVAGFPQGFSQGGKLCQIEDFSVTLDSVEATPESLTGESLTAEIRGTARLHVAGEPSRCQQEMQADFYDGQFPPFKITTVPTGWDCGFRVRLNGPSDMEVLVRVQHCGRASACRTVRFHGSGPPEIRDDCPEGVPPPKRVRIVPKVRPGEATAVDETETVDTPLDKEGLKEATDRASKHFLKKE